MMMNASSRPLRLLFFISTCWLFSCMAGHAKRVALVIGNSAYTHGVPLSNPANDAQAITGALKAAQFEVISATDASLVIMEEKIVEFRRKAEGAEAAWFFYAGHGVEVNGSNYLVPVDAEVKEEFQVKHKTLALDLVLGALDEARTPLKVVVLDCCRDNPFGRGWSRSAVGGLGQVNGTPEGTIIAFAAAPGKTASDGRGNNSPYTLALLEAMKSPGMDIDQVFKETGRLVIASTKRAQQPWINSSFYDRFVLVPGNMAGLPAAAPLPSLPPPAPRGPETATKESPFVNTLGMRFVPVMSYNDGKKVLFNIWETRRQDYAAYASEVNGVDGTWRNVTSYNQPVGHADDHPVVGVSWEDAKAFCAWLTRKERATGRIQASDEYRLPTDLEWSYAVGIGAKEDASLSPMARDAKLEGVYPWGGDYPPSGSVGNYADDEFSFLSVIEGNRDGYATTAPVGSYAANEKGLYDLGGNVFEWCEDRYNAYREYRVLRGGSWNYGDSRILLSSGRLSGYSSDRSDDYGFRVVLVVGSGG